MGLEWSTRWGLGWTIQWGWGGVKLGGGVEYDVGVE